MLGLEIKSTRRLTRFTKPVAIAKTKRSKMFALNGCKETKSIRPAFQPINNSLMDELMARDAFSSIKPESMERAQAA